MTTPGIESSGEIKDLLDALFDEVLTIFVEIDCFSKESSPSIFLVYAHENPSVGNANAAWAVQLIQWLGKVRSKTFSDKSLVPGLWATREDDFASVHDVLSNQFCLLPARSHVGKGRLVTRVDKVVICCSEVLQHYSMDTRMIGYTKAVTDFYSDAEKTYQDADTIENGMEELVRQYRNEDGFHHVITELAFLKIRSPRAEKRHDIIPVVFNGNDISYLPYFDQTQTVWIKVQDVPSMLHPCQSLHKSFFKILRRIYEDEERTIKEIEDIYLECAQSLPSQGSLPEYEVFRETISMKKRKMLKNLDRSLYADIRVGPPSAPQPSPIFFVPFQRNANFVGRESIIVEMDRKLSSTDICQRVSMWGLGGTGKTQIALEYAFRRRKAVPGCAVFWIPAISIATFEKAYLDIGKLLNIPGISEPMADIKKLVREELNKEETGQWLLIVDNADDTDVLLKEPSPGTSPLMDYLPSSPKGSIIFTTRTRVAAVKQVNAKENRVEVSEMSDIEATDLLKRILGETAVHQEREAVEELLDLLARLPLAIIQAASFIAENGCSIADYISMFKSSEANTIEMLSNDFEDRNRYRAMKNPVATTWLISFEQIQKKDPLAATYLSFIACLLRENIPQSLLPKGTTTFNEVRAVGTLTAYSFLMKQEKSNLFDMHRLVHLVTRNWLKDQGHLASQMEITLSRISEVLPYGGHKDYNIWGGYLPHATCVATSSMGIVKWTARADLLDKIGRCQQSIGQYKAAVETHQQVLELRKSQLGEKDWRTSISMNEVGLALSGQGKYAESEVIQRSTMGLWQKVLGMEHPETLVSMNNLGYTLSHQGKYTEAEVMHRSTLVLRQKVLGMEHPETLTSMDNLGDTLSHQGKYTEAEVMHRSTLVLKQKVLGMEHPETLASRNNLGYTLNAQGKYTEAEVMHRSTLVLKQKVLGMEHPETLASMNNLGDTLSRQGKYAEAEAMHLSTLELKQKVLGMEHPETLTSMMWVATMLAEQGNKVECKNMYKQILKTQEKVLGKDHPDTQISRSYL